MNKNYFESLNECLSHSSGKGFSKDPNRKDRFNRSYITVKRLDNNPNYAICTLSDDKEYRLPVKNIIIFFNTGNAFENPTEKLGYIEIVAEFNKAISPSEVIASAITPIMDVTRGNYFLAYGDFSRKISLRIFFEYNSDLIIAETEYSELDTFHKDASSFKFESKNQA